MYGLTHLEEYKWEQWEEESKGKPDIGARDVIDQPSNDSFSTTTPTPVSTANPTPFSVSVPSQQPAIKDIQPELGSALSIGNRAMMSDGRESSSIKNSQSEIQSRNSYDVHLETSRPLPTNTDISLYPNTAESHTSTNTLSSVPAVHSSIVTSGGHSESAPSVQHSTRISTPVAASSVVHASVATSSFPSASPTATSSSSGESIYRVIMNRLTALEANHTLYVRYVEQQNTAIRDLLKRLGEDVGRLEGIVSIDSLLDRATCRLTVGSSPWTSTSTHCARMGETEATAPNGTQRIYGSSRIFVGRGARHVRYAIPDIKIHYLRLHSKSDLASLNCACYY